MNPAQEKRRKNNRRGVTVVETVIAMAIITIVCYTALTVIKASQTTAGEDSVYNQTRYRAQAALECFKFSDSLSEFENAVAYASLSGSNGNYTYETYSATLTMTVFYPETVSGSETARPAFHAVARGKNGKLLFTVDYEKSTVGQTGGAAEP